MNSSLLNPVAPLVSIVMPVYHSDEYLAESIESILNQTYQNIELIIICDDPTTITREIINHYQKKDNRIYVFYQSRIGLIASLNQGCSAATGKYIARMDADDICVNSRLEKQVLFLENHPEVGLIGTYMKEIDSQGNPGPSVFQPPVEHDLIVWKMLFDCVVAHPTIMFRTTLFQEYGGYNPEYIHIEDTELWSRWIFNTQFSNIPEFLLYRRWHEKSICNIYAHIQIEKNVEIRHKMITKFLQKNVEYKNVKLLYDILNKKGLNNGKALLFTESLFFDLYETYQKKWVKKRANLPAIQRDIINRLLDFCSISLNLCENYSILKTSLKINGKMTLMISVERICLIKNQILHKFSMKF